jgi:hypothetical protein
MREITTHVVDGDQASQLKIEVLDQPGVGGASHIYAISGLQLSRNSAALYVPDGVAAKYDDDTAATIIFQCGGIPDSGVNGVTNEALLAIVIDRLECLQAGPFAAQENATALSNAREALRALQKRTMARIRRGVEGQQVA